MFSVEITEAVAAIPYTEKFCSFKMTYKGTTYTRDQIVVIHQNEGVFIFGKIIWLAI